MKKIQASELLLYGLLLISLVAYVLLAWWVPRESVFQVIGLYGGLFLIYSILLQNWKPSFGLLLGAAFVFRLVFLGTIPALSDDYFRFVWDGRLWAIGENPFLHLPGYYLEEGHQIAGLTQSLYDNLNSPEYFTIYPPVCQGIFALGAWLFPDNLLGHVITMRAVLLVGDVLGIYYLYRLLDRFNLPGHHVLWYALNPLVIVELTGNLHFEGLMIAFLFWAVYLLTTYRLHTSAFVLALSVCTKLIPLMFLPFLFKRLGWTKSVKYYLLTGLWIVVLFLPFLSLELFENFFSSVDLYFQKFEFNAGFYYIARWIGIEISGYNLIKYIGAGFTVLAGLVIVLMALLEKDAGWRKLPQKMLMAQAWYYFLATTVHPWYITTLVAHSLFTRFRFAIVWSALATLSYYTYLTDAYVENLGLVAVEYTVVFSWLLVEWRVARKAKKLTKKR